MGLYQEYRPTTLDAVKGNSVLKNTLSALLKQKKLPQVFMLHGPTGCGKTTIGRIIMTEIGVHTDDLKEINSSDFRGIDTVREIIKNAGYKPLKGQYRGFLLDEVHQLTKDAQNALLKFLEDTPKHVIVILATTEPAKLLPTVKNRCIDLEVKLLTEREMKTVLVPIAKAEKVQLEPEIYAQIIESAQGHPRTGIQILEKVINTEPDFRLEVAKKATDEKAEVIELCRALLGNSSWQKVKEILVNIKDQDPESIRRMVLGYAQAVLLKSDNPRAGLVLEEFLEPTYNSGFPQIVYACYSIIKN